MIVDNDWTFPSEEPNILLPLCCLSAGSHIPDNKEAMVELPRKRDQSHLCGLLEGV